MSTNEEHKVTRKTWLPDAGTPRKPKRDWWAIATLASIIAIFLFALTIGVVAIQDRDRRNDEIRSSLTSNTKDLYGVHVTVRRGYSNWGSFSIFDEDCIYIADVVQADNGERTFVRGTERLDHARVTIKSDSAVAADCPAKPLSDDLSRLANGG